MRWFRQSRKRRLAGNVPASIRRALGAALAHDLDAVDEALTEVVRADSSDADAYLGLASVYRKRGELGRSISLSQTLALRRDLDSSQKSRALSELAAGFREGGFLARSIEVYEEILRKDRRDAVALEAMSELMREQGEFSRAIEFLRRRSRVCGLSLKEQEAVLWRELALQLREGGQADACRRALRRALKCDPESAEVALSLGEAERERGRWKAAMKLFFRAAGLDSNVAARAYLGIEACRPKLSRRGVYEGMIRSQLAEAPQDVEARVALARCLLIEGRASESMNELEEIVREDPWNTVALVVFLRSMAARSSEDSDESDFKGYADFLEEVDLHLSTSSHSVGRGR